MTFDLTGFQRDLLFVIGALDEPTGQEIKAELEQTQERTIQEGQLYRNLNVLVDRGLVEKHPGTGRTNTYRNTDEGDAAARELHDWRLDHTAIESS
jgi:DNA-binding PadR family transcriptional regulator